MNNISLGNGTESLVSKLLRKHGYWCHILKKGNSGEQPFDIIAIKNSNQTYLVWLIDGKHIRENDVSFKFSRVEDNQIVSMRYAHDFARIETKRMGFAIQFDRAEDVYWLPYDMVVDLLEKGVKSVHYTKLRTFEEELNENENK